MWRSIQVKIVVIWDPKDERVERNRMTFETRSLSFHGPRFRTVTVVCAGGKVGKPPTTTTIRVPTLTALVVVLRTWIGITMEEGRFFPPWNQELLRGSFLEQLSPFLI